MSEKLPFYGGQALIEGVLMRGSHTVVATIKDANGQIHIRQEELGGIYQGRIKKIPFLRGIISLWDALILGTQFLTISANLQTDNPDEKIEGVSLYITLFLSIGFAILLFFVAPASLSHLFEQMLPSSPWLGNLIEGLIRVIIMVVYLVAIQKIPDVKRVFMYHGAEHKTINAFEDNAELTPEAVSKYSLFHPRCGTGFLLTVVLFSIIIFSILGPLPLFLRIISRIVFIIPLASMAYEYIRWSSSHLKNPLVRILIAPNLWLQRLTTADPTFDMLDIAITSLREVIKKRGSHPDMKTWQSVMMGFIGGAISIGVIFIFASQPRGEAIQLSVLPTPLPIKVYITGAVSKPGVYSVDLENRVEDVIKLAGGLLDTADKDTVNMASSIKDGEKILVPYKITPDLQGFAAGTSRPSLSTRPVFPIDINRATQDELILLPAIGDTKAAAIISYREKQGFFSKIEEIKNVPGIGAGIYAQIKDLIIVR